MRKIFRVVDFFLVMIISLSLSQTNIPNCLSNPSTHGCENYILPSSNVTSDINILCRSMPDMPGCTLSRECANKHGSGPYCEPFSHLKEICTDMGGMMGCKDYNSLCPSNTIVHQCNTSVLALPSQKDLWKWISDMCTNMPMPDCKRCPSSDQCDVLLVYSALCVSMPMEQCGDWSNMCKKIPDWELCVGVPAPDCLTEPWVPGCENYILPKSNVTSDINNLCSSMPDMPGCSVSRECANQRASGRYCEPFSHLKEICTEMGGMMGCKDYNSLCPSNTIVHQCNTSVLPLPSQQDLWKRISDMCKEMYMSDCERCTSSGQCDVLLVYSSLCFSMPGMPQCSSWHQICGIVPDWVICAGESNQLQPIMRMYFHTDITDYILFYQWVPRDTVTYALSVLGVFLIAFLHEALRTAKSILEYKIRRKESQKFQESASLLSHPSKAKYPPFSFFKEFFHAFLRTLDTTAHFLVMLIAMTFNVGLFVAVMLGYGLGYLVFGRFLRPLGPLVVSELGEGVVDCH